MDSDSREKMLARRSEKAFKTARNAYLKRLYGIDLDTYNALLAKQKYSCAVCGTSDAQNRSKRNIFSVDHNHITGQIRGLLCNFCNRIVMPVAEHYSHLFEPARKYLSKYHTKE